MKIMHYIFGIPPLRGGGAIKYAMDLAEEQAKQGHDTTIIYPGEIRRRKKGVRIISNRKWGRMRIYEIINPLPVPLVTGIREPGLFMAAADKGVYCDFLGKTKPDVLHIHSLMGLHMEFLQAAKELGIKMVFTTHDYFGICPKTNLLYRGKLCGDCRWEHCGECCEKAEDISILVRRQSHWFQLLIHFKQLVKLKHFLWKNLKRGEGVDENNRQHKMINAADEGKHRGCDGANEGSQEVSDRFGGVKQPDSYECLRKYYLAELAMMDIIHYNSSVVRRQYEKRIRPQKSVILGGMHKDIHDHRKKRKYGKIVRFSYLGYAVDYKGYYLLLEVLDELSRKYGSQFILNTYMGDEGEKRDYIRQHERYTYGQLEQVYDGMDLLVVPSLCAETYGLVTLEALSYGVPVIVTENVGAGDLLVQNPGMGFIVNPDYDGLYQALEQVLKDKARLQEMNEAICGARLAFGYEDYVDRVVEMYG